MKRKKTPNNLELRAPKYSKQLFNLTYAHLALVPTEVDGHVVFFIYSH